jgi:hypothetical protein
MAAFRFSGGVLSLVSAGEQVSAGDMARATGPEKPPARVAGDIASHRHFAGMGIAEKQPGGSQLETDEKTEVEERSQRSRRSPRDNLAGFVGRLCYRTDDRRKTSCPLPRNH